MPPQFILLGPPRPLGWEGTFRLGRACSPSSPAGPLGHVGTPASTRCRQALPPPFPSFFADLSIPRRALFPLLWLVEKGRGL